MALLTISNLHFNSNIITTESEMFDIFDRTLEQKSKGYFIALNPEKIVNTANKDEWAKIWSNALGVYPDGVGIVYAVKILEGKKVKRFFPLEGIFKKLQEKKGRLFLFGTEEQALFLAKNKIHNIYPDIQIVGSISGFGYENKKVVDEINKVNPDLIVVALGSPLQEEWIHENLPLVDRGIFLGVGGALDALSGKTKRAPVFFQKIGMEWLFRLVTQPSRFRRQLKLVTFVRAVFIEKFRRLFKS